MLCLNCRINGYFKDAVIGNRTRSGGRNKNGRQKSGRHEGVGHKPGGTFLDGWTRGRTTPYNPL